jgi:Holliday junction resolvase RusA-like endonuclease
MKTQEGFVTFYQNPYYDDLMLFMLDKPIPPKQRKGKAQRRESEVWLRKEFEEMKPKKLGWPYMDKIMLVFSVTGPADYLENVDIDNIAKMVLDCCKGLVYIDDKQIFSLIAEKHVSPKQPGLVIAIRRMAHGEFADFVPALYSQDPDTWPAEGFERITSIKME